MVKAEEREEQCTPWATVWATGIAPMKPTTGEKAVGNFTPQPALLGENNMGKGKSEDLLTHC